MTGKTRHYRDWLLIETITGWFIEKGDRRIRIGSSREELTDDLYYRYIEKVDELEGEEDGGEL